MAERRTDARHLVGSDADADACATDEDTAVTFTACNSARCRFGDQRIVAGFVAVCAKIDHLVAEGLQMFLDGAFEIKTTVVRA